MLNNENPGNGRILALDLGKKRIGLAISDPLGLTGQGLPTLQRKNLRTDLDELDRIAEEKGVVLIVLGNPLHMDGSESRQSAYTREFADKLVARTGRRVEFWDERLTSVEAGRVLRESGISIVKRAKAVDKLAAQLLLESYLMAHAEYDDEGETEDSSQTSDYDFQEMHDADFKVEPVE